MPFDIDMDSPLTTKPAQDTYFIEGIRGGSKKVLDEIYKKYFPTVQRLVTRNSGTLEDAKDIFQEVLVAIFDRLHRDSFVLTCQFGTFLYSVARNLWFKQLRRNNIHFIDIENTETSESFTQEESEEVTLMNERYQLYIRKFQEIGEQCRNLLLRFMQGADMKTIAVEFGFASEAYAKKRKFKCKEQLIQKIEEDADYKRVMNRG